MKSYFLYAILLLILVSCISDPEKPQLDYNSYGVEDFPSVEANIVFVKGEGAQFEKINKVIVDSTLAYLMQEEPVDSIQEALEKFVKNYQSFKKDFPESDQVWELSVETEVVFQTETVITYSINTYSYTGGAHGNDHITLLNFNASNGDLIGISDLIRKPREFKAIARQKFIESQKATNESFRMEDYFFGEDFELPENMGYSEDGFVLLYNVYEIASYAQGYTEFAIPFEDLDGILKFSPY
jgi:hypothetical protein